MFRVTTNPSILSQTLFTTLCNKCYTSLLSLDYSQECKAKTPLKVIIFLVYKTLQSPLMHYNIVTRSRPIWLKLWSSCSMQSLPHKILPWAWLHACLLSHNSSLKIWQKIGTQILSYKTYISASLPTWGCKFLKRFIHIHVNVTRKQSSTRAVIGQFCSPYSTVRDIAKPWDFVPCVTWKPRVYFGR